TNIVRTEFALAPMVAHRHASPALGTKNQTLEQSWAFSRWPTALPAAGLPVLLKTLLILLELFPGDIRRMSILDQSRPLLPRQADTVPFAMRIFPRARAAKTKCSRITWIAQCIQCDAVPELFPDDLTRARLPVLGKLQPFFLERFDCCPG